ncbi:MAG: aldo/keto reductase, partial [Firmicutes bacterium]|nr:aldo/keto reductase [Bacillota bacterium]
SNMRPDRFIDLAAYNKITPAVNQIETHLYCQRREDRVWLEKYGIAHQAYTPLGQGRANEMFEEAPVKALAQKYGKTPAQVLLRFLVQGNVAVIPKSVHEERLKENIDIFDFELTDEEMHSLEALDKNAPMIGRAEDPVRTEESYNWS